jgi:hypothetical protein
MKRERERERERERGRLHYRNKIGDMLEFMDCGG